MGPVEFGGVDSEHPVATDKNHYRYFFYGKHHAQHESDEAQWLRQLWGDPEFQIFNQADKFDILGENGDLFGLRRDAQGRVLPLGTRGEEVAEFPRARENDAWHGYPMWPISRKDPEGRQRLPVPRAALKRMVEIGWLTKGQSKRSQAGKRIFKRSL
ncbi:MAG: hypothetical protein ACLP7Q_08910 [Isosphaeraceae bacterium]